MSGHGAARDGGLWDGVQVVARDGIEPPTRGLFRAAGLAWALRATTQSAARDGGLWDGVQVVARDGIEPPTPAFSGPRSTTELPGLGEIPRNAPPCRAAWCV